MGATYLKTSPTRFQIRTLPDAGKKDAASGTHEPASKGLLPGDGELHHALRRILMRTCPFFSNMNEEEVAGFLRFCAVKKLPPLHVIFSKGEAAEEFYVIVSGSVVVEPGDEETREVRVGPGETFGEMALLESTSRSGKAWTETDTTLLIVPRTFFEAGAIGLREKVLKTLAKQLSRNVRRTDFLLEIYQGANRLASQKKP